MILGTGLDNDIFHKKHYVFAELIDTLTVWRYDLI